jgi:hypothetical protein
MYFKTKFTKHRSTCRQTRVDFKQNLIHSAADNTNAGEAPISSVLITTVPKPLIKHTISLSGTVRNQQTQPCSAIQKVLEDLGYPSSKQTDCDTKSSRAQFPVQNSSSIIPPHVKARRGEKARDRSSAHDVHNKPARQ